MNIGSFQNNNNEEMEFKVLHIMSKKNLTI
jgi:hypothetical protein